MTTFAPRQESTAAPQRRLWLITFVDLVMLLLAFFVLLFSMSSLDHERFATVARAYADAFNPLGGIEDVAVGPQRVPPQARPDGNDLAYLETVLRTAFARSPDLGAIQFRLTPQYLILSLPPVYMDDKTTDQKATGQGAQVLDDETQRRVFDIGGVLSNVPNRIAVVVHASLGSGAAGWVASRNDAQAVRQALIKSGYPHPFASLVRGADEAAGRTDTATPIEILVMPDAESSP
jgi:chemotaxis protein MotB